MEELYFLYSMHPLLMQCTHHKNKGRRLPIGYIFLHLLLISFSTQYMLTPEKNGITQTAFQPPNLTMSFLRPHFFGGFCVMREHPFSFGGVSHGHTGLMSWCQANMSLSNIEQVSRQTSESCPSKLCV